MFNSLGVGAVIAFVGTGEIEDTGLLIGSLALMLGVTVFASIARREEWS